MKRIKLREFSQLDMSNYNYVFELDNQAGEYKDRCLYVTEDRRVFEDMLIALNPDCVKFVGSCGSCLTIDGIDCICIRNMRGDGNFFFDVICNIRNAGRFVMTFLATKK